MLDEAVECETQFAEDLLGRGRRRAVASPTCAQYLEYVADQRLADARPAAARYGAKNPFGFMELQDVQELTNFFERRVGRTRSASPATSPSTKTSDFHK